MLSDSVRAFIGGNLNAVLATSRRDGATQMSIVSVGPYGGGAAFTTTEGTAKVANLRRSPRCSLLVSRDDWSGYVVLEGHARVLSSDTTEADELRQALRDVYRAVGRKEHPDWEEYDQAMLDDRRAAVVVIPERVYGTAV